MIKNSLRAILFSLLFISSLQAQQGFEIQIKLTGYSYDTIWFGQTVGKRAEQTFFALKQAEGEFLLKSDAPLAQGMYALGMKRSAGAPLQYLPCWLADGQRKFSIRASFNQLLETATSTDSEENQNYFTYLRDYESLTNNLDRLCYDWKDMEDEATFEAVLASEAVLQQYQLEFTRKHPGSLTAKLVEQTRFAQVPDPEHGYNTWREKADAWFAWQREHFFDRMNLASDDFLRQPLWLDRTDFYVLKLSQPNPESMIALLETVFKQLQPNAEAYQYYFRYMMNSLSRMSRYRTDEVFVHFVRTYVDKGKVDWLAAADIEKYQSEAKRMEPLFEGKKVPNVTFYDKDNQALILYKVESPYTLLVFWRYDCSHCRKELPILKNVYQQYESKGLKVVAVCGNSGEAAMPSCWEFAKSLPMPAEWSVVADPLRRSRFSALFNVSGYPRFFLLDADKNIIFKQAGEASEKALIQAFGKVMQ